MRSSLWSLAERPGNQFEVSSIDGRVSIGEILRSAVELSEFLGKEKGRNGSGLVAIACTHPVATVISLMAATRVRWPFALVDPAGLGYIEEKIADLPVTVVLCDQGEVSFARRCIGQSCISSDRGAFVNVSAYGASSGHRLRYECGYDVDDEEAGLPIVFSTSGASATGRWVVHTEASLWASVESKIDGMARFGRLERTSDIKRLIDAVIERPRAVGISLSSISGYTQLLHCIAIGVPLAIGSGLLPRQMVRLAQQSRAGTLVVTPTMLQLMLLVCSRLNAEFPYMGLIGVGGGRLDPHIAFEAETRFGARIIQGYGSTELGGAVTNGRIYDSPDVRCGTVGRALGGVEIEIRRQDGGVASRGEVGEVVVRAPNRFARGYLSGSDRARIVALEMRDDAYWTGDVGLIREDQNLVLLGRSDGRVTRSDQTFSLEDVEEVLEAHARVVRAVVRAEESEFKLRIVARCEMSEGVGVPASELMAWCRQRLSRPQCPDVIELGPVSMTVTGKKVFQRPGQQTAEIDRHGDGGENALR